MDEHSLPLHPTDGQMVADQYGNIFQYNLSHDQWLPLGIIVESSEVSESNPGLVPPDVYERIMTIKNSGIDFTKSRLITNVGCYPYFYYFYSPDNTINFKPFIYDNKKYLQVEINRAYVLSLFARMPCAGAKGLQGPKGKSGVNGTKAPNEKFKIPIYESSQSLRINQKVNTPYSTNISLRIYDGDACIGNGNKVLEIVFSTKGEIVNIIEEEGYKIDTAKTKLTFVNNILNTNIVLSEGQFNKNFRYKVRQMGLKGLPGDDGSPFIEIVNDVYDTSILSIDFYSSMMYKNKNIVAVKTAYNPKCADLLKLSNINYSDYAVSIEPTTKSCKKILYYNFTDEITIPELILPNWYPEKSCTSKRYEIPELDWNDSISPIIDECFVTGIPSIIRSDALPQDCCKEDLFICVDVSPSPNHDCPIDIWESSSSSSSSSSSVFYRYVCVDNTAYSNINCVTELFNIQYCADRTGYDPPTSDMIEWMISNNVDEHCFNYDGSDGAGITWTSPSVFSVKLILGILTNDYAECERICFGGGSSSESSECCIGSDIEVQGPINFGLLGGLDEFGYNFNVTNWDTAEAVNNPVIYCQNNVQQIDVHSLLFDNRSIKNLFEECLHINKVVVNISSSQECLDGVGCSTVGIDSNNECVGYGYYINSDGVYIYNDNYDGNIAIPPIPIQLLPCCTYTLTFSIEYSLQPYWYCCLITYYTNSDCTDAIDAVWVCISPNESYDPPFSEMLTYILENPTVRGCFTPDGSDISNWTPSIGEGSIELEIIGAGVCWYDECTCSP